jgi:hypothetical protein
LPGYSGYQSALCHRLIIGHKKAQESQKGKKQHFENTRSGARFRFVLLSGPVHPVSFIGHKKAQESQKGKKQHFENTRSGARFRFVLLSGPVHPVSFIGHKKAQESQKGGKQNIETQEGEKETSKAEQVSHDCLLCCFPVLAHLLLCVLCFSCG